MLGIVYRLNLKVYLFYFRERERRRESVCMGVCGVGSKGQRERERENPRQSPHLTWKPTQGSIPRPWNHDLSWNQRVQTLNWLSHSGGPRLCFFFFLKFIYFEKQSRGKAEKRESQAGSALSVQSLTRGSNSQTMRSWPEPKSDASLTEPTRCPIRLHFLKKVFNCGKNAHNIKLIILSM